MGEQSQTPLPTAYVPSGHWGHLGTAIITPFEDTEKLRPRSTSGTVKVTHQRELEFTPTSHGSPRTPESDMLRSHLGSAPRAV